jgi:hypothetical protein
MVGLLIRLPRRGKQARGVSEGGEAKRSPPSASRKRNTIYPTIAIIQKAIYPTIAIIQKAIYPTIAITCKTAIAILVQLSIYRLCSIIALRENEEARL